MIAPRLVYEESELVHERSPVLPQGSGIDCSRRSDEAKEVAVKIRTPGRSVCCALGRRGRPWIRRTLLIAVLAGVCAPAASASTRSADRLAATPFAGQAK